MRTPRPVTRPTSPAVPDSGARGTARSGGPVPAGLLARSGSGVFAVTIGHRRRDRALARRCGHHRTGAVPVRLVVAAAPGGQRWTRTVDGRTLTTTVTWQDETLVERSGPVELAFRIARASAGARLDLCGAGLRRGPVRLSVPRCLLPLLPAVTCRTRPTRAGLRVRVDIRARRGRPMLTYAGVVT